MTTWYLARDERRHVRQVVIHADPCAPQEPRFGMLVLGPQYEMLMSSPWVTGVFRMDGAPGPYVLARADGGLDSFRTSPLQVVFSFHHEPAGGLFGLFVGAESDALRRASPTGLPFAESLSGLDVQDAVDRIRDALERSHVHLCFAESSSSSRVRIAGRQSEAEGAVAPVCRFDRVVPLPEDCRAALSGELQALLRHHRSIAAGGRDFHTSMAQLNQDFPQSETPVLGREHAVSASASRTEPSAPLAAPPRRTSAGPISRAEAAERLAELRRQLDAECAPDLPPKLVEFCRAALGTLHTARNFGTRSELQESGARVGASLAEMTRLSRDPRVERIASIVMEYYDVLTRERGAVADLLGRIRDRFSSQR